MSRSVALLAVSFALLAGPALAQSTSGQPPVGSMPASSPATQAVGAGNAYGPGVPPFPSQNDGRLLMREGVFVMSNGSTARVQVLSNSPVPNPGDVPGQAQGGMAMNAQSGVAPVGAGSAYPPGSQPLASQTDGVLLLRELTMVDPSTGASTTTRVLSNTPVPNPESVRASRGRRARR